MLSLLHKSLLLKYLILLHLPKPPRLLYLKELHLLIKLLLAEPLLQQGTLCKMLRLCGLLSEGLPDELGFQSLLMVF